MKPERIPLHVSARVLAVMRRAAIEHGVTVAELRCERRVLQYVAARKQCFQRLRELGFSLGRIAQLFGMTHGTVHYHLHGRRR